MLPEKVILDGTVLRSKSGKLELDPQGLKALQEAVAKAHASTSAFNVVVSGFSYFTSSRTRNIAISRRCAEFVAKALARQGIPPEKITVKAIGLDHPIADNSTQAGRLKNRRVEVEFLGD